MVEIKFCGLTRRDDVAAAVDAGAGYVGVVLAGGPRHVSDDQAAALLEAAGIAKRVGVFGAAPAAEVAERARALRLDVAQLHGDPTPDFVATIRRAFDGDLWPVVRLAAGESPGDLAPLFAVGDAVVLDAKVPGRPGGSGAVLDWGQIAHRLTTRAPGRRLVLAGGLTPENVADAIAVLSPDVVDVSSGVESAPGIKDHGRLRAFARAVRLPGSGT